MRGSAHRAKEHRTTAPALRQHAEAQSTSWDSDSEQEQFSDHLSRDDLSRDDLSRDDVSRDDGRVQRWGALTPKSIAAWAPLLRHKHSKLQCILIT